MRRQLVIGNWKMNGSTASNKALVSNLLEGLGGSQVGAAEIAVCTPSVYLSVVGSQLQNSAIKLGAQNVSQFSSGAYTGEVSAPMLTELGVSYVLVGHSERRAMFGESSELVAEKVFASIEAGLTPVVCVGETRKERESGRTLEVIESQLQAVLGHSANTKQLKYIVAYEPVWAIGTGLTATPEQAQEVHHFIRGLLGDEGETTSILYGGSVKASSAAELFAQADIDGGLVGGASLQAEEFLAIWQAAVQISSESAKL